MAGFFERLMGLMFKPSLGPNEGLWLRRCRAIHTFFMRFDIDVIFLNRDLRVVKLCEGVPPNRLGPFCFAADSVLECRAGFIARNGIALGNVLVFRRGGSEVLSRRRPSRLWLSGRRTRRG